jgi:cytochrome c553
VADQEIKMDAGNKALMVVSVLVLLAAVVFLVAHLVGFLGQVALGERDPAPAVMETIDQRIAPVGRVEVAAVDPDAKPAAPKAPGEVYSSVCAACHDAGVAGAPRADDGGEWARRFEEKGLDTLVSHAINGFQGMPARGGNPSLTDEEVAGSVAYLLSNAGVSVDAEVAEAEAPAAEAAAAPAVAGDAEAGKDRFATCVSCHGAEAQGMGIFPKLAGQSAEYIAGRLQQYRAGETVGPTSALMMPHASGLSDEAIADLAAYVATFGAPAEAPAEAPPAAEEEAAAEAPPAAEEEAAPAAAGDAEAGKGRFGACASCHGPQGQGMGIFPKIAGQSAEYIAGRLQQYRAGETVGPTSALMMPHASGLSDEAIADLAAYISSL